MKVFEPHEGRVVLKHSFSESWYFLSGRGEVHLETERGAIFRAKASITKRGPHKGKKTIRFLKDKQEFARSYPCCWWHYYNCYGTRIGMYCKALDNYISNLNHTLAHAGQFDSIMGEIKVTYPIKRSEIWLWSEKYDRDHPWWVEKEKDLGDRLRSNEELGLEELKEIVEWKFKGRPGRLKYIMRLISKNADGFIRKISKSALQLSLNQDAEKLVFLISKEVLNKPGRRITSKNYIFQADKFGPFSEEVYDDFETLLNLELVETNESRGVFSITEKGERLVIKLLNSNYIPISLIVEIEKIKKRWNNVSLKSLLKYVYKNYEDYTLESEIRDKILRN